MPFVPVPKDLTQVKTKVAFNLTKRQLICFSLGALIGIPTYIFTRGIIGNDAAVFLMIGLMLPFFFMAMFNKNGMPFEKVVAHYVRARFINSSVRPYRTENFYAALERQTKEKLHAEQEWQQKTKSAGKKAAQRSKPVKTAKTRNKERPKKTNNAQR